MENLQRQQVKIYFDLLFLHWRIMAACLLVAITMGIGVYLRMPRVYQCTSLLSFEHQQISPDSITPAKDNRLLLDTISILSDVVTRHSNLEDISKQFNLYAESRLHHPGDAVIDMMRQHIKITPSSGGGTFTVSFEGQDQNTVLGVTNALAGRFVEESRNHIKNQEFLLDSKQKSSKIKIVDSAVFPDKPCKPSFMKFLLVSVGAGLAAGTCLVFIMDYFDTSFQDAWEIESYLDIPVVISIPYLERQEETGKKGEKTVIWSTCLLLYSTLLLVALIFFWKQGRIVL